MRRISQKNRLAIENDPYFRKCARADGECQGRITIEHAFIYAGKQMDELWTFVPLCWRHHLGDLLDKRINRKLAIIRATDGELEEAQKKYPHVDWKRERVRYSKDDPRISRD